MEVGTATRKPKLTIDDVSVRLLQSYQEKQGLEQRLKQVDKEILGLSNQLYALSQSTPAASAPMMEEGGEHAAQVGVENGKPKDPP
jgi:cell division septum initiation protein DivIVA